MLPVTSFFRIFKRTVVTNRPMLTKLLNRHKSQDTPTRPQENTATARSGATGQMDRSALSGGLFANTPPLPLEGAPLPVIDMYIEPATIRCRAGMDMNWGTNCRASSAADLCLYSLVHARRASPCGKQALMVCESSTDIDTILIRAKGQGRVSNVTYAFGVATATTNSACWPTSAGVTEDVATTDIAGAPDGQERQFGRREAREDNVTRQMQKGCESCNPKHPLHNHRQQQKSQSRPRGQARGNAHTGILSRYEDTTTITTITAATVAARRTSYPASSLLETTALLSDGRPGMSLLRAGWLGQLFFF
ncbi:hypothetical protein CCM_04332 [Cordyceps militaris CM01]|uniref:Uncharacterized protein n=1 Tax=Cordyceps militaris (strain CM01) TaxID=983644 RepID=G3JEE7_CORMM|nr:uncharacterized protein CCM_04332 [Cordyceps militaris CM01]EGX92960.1 hypothetical protein CCM_04332 [Cordyceps militaris CM01]